MASSFFLRHSNLVTDLCQRVENSLRERCQLRRGGRLLVAVSGGVDSMVLLRVLHSLAGVWDLNLCVAHFNHQLRGRSSDLDEKLVRQTGAALGLPVIVESAAVKTFAQKSRLSIEMAARKLRHEFLARVARERKIPAIALAHHADDQVELFFLRLLRGSGGEGLAGMKWRGRSPMDKRLSLIRPLLNLTKAELEAYATEQKIRFRADATNASLAMPRNRVRHELLPLLRKHYQPGLTKTILRVMDIASAESELAGEEASQWLAGSSLPFAALPVAIQRRVLQVQLQKLGLPVDFDLVEQLRVSVNTPVCAGMHLLVRRNAAGKLKLLSRAAAEFQSNELVADLSARAGELTFGGVKLSWKRLPAAKLPMPKAQAGREIFDAERIGTSIVLRHWRPGDRFQPLGMKSAVKLQDLFTNAKIPREKRHHLLVAAADGEIFWVEGLRMAERFKLSAETKNGLVWQWRSRV